LTIEDAIYTFLVATSEITDEVAIESICWNEADQDVENPKIVFKNISKPNISDSDDQWQRWRFFITAVDKRDCLRIARVLFNQMHRKDDQLDDDFQVDFINNVSNSDPEYNETSQVWEILQDYRITYH
jgi:hypothetical protein